MSRTNAGERRQRYIGTRTNGMKPNSARRATRFGPHVTHPELSHFQLARTRLCTPSLPVLRTIAAFLFPIHPLFRRCARCVRTPARLSLPSTARSNHVAVSIQRELRRRLQGFPRAGFERDSLQREQGRRRRRRQRRWWRRRRRPVLTERQGKREEQGQGQG